MCLPLCAENRGSARGAIRHRSAHPPAILLQHSLPSFRTYRPSALQTQPYCRNYLEYTTTIAQQSKQRGPCGEGRGCGVQKPAPGSTGQGGEGCRVHLQGRQEVLVTAVLPSAPARLRRAPEKRSKQNGSPSQAKEAARRKALRRAPVYHIWGRAGSAATQQGERIRGES